MDDERDWASILAGLHRDWRRRWLLWAVVYVAGFAFLWIAGLAEGWPFYAWAIGWALVKGVWDESRFRRAAERQDRRRLDETG